MKKKHKEQEKGTLIIRIDRELKDKLKKIAEQSHRKMSDYIRLLINKASEENIKL